MPAEGGGDKGCNQAGSKGREWSVRHSLQRCTVAPQRKTSPHAAARRTRQAAQQIDGALVDHRLAGWPAAASFHGDTDGGGCKAITAEAAAACNGG